ncbi:ParB N-terminal domain-containing protein [Lacisediminihabitans profunda]|uniref:Chromosome partitioning protein ParB n=1 Tax=Lacisediminihabitans profunda TaxID=2594790 RepID=A0A5C8UPI2_9MICO|nr:ParB N-terminal domain-containing protein [Lacisediminihabitans profunda]TXN29804.1 chromosome partitioning protein ParB [Lacisediminihabitans profunda]
MSDGHIELARAVDSIRVGLRFRRDFGDLDELCESIGRLGLLQPITISPDGTLICGARRYAAVRKLGWKTINVWVRSGISTDLERALAEQHENTMRKPFTPTEAARLYTELKHLYQEDAARRKQITQFASGGKDGEFAGSGNFPGPHGESRVQAARAIGAGSYRTLEHVAGVQRLADDPATPLELRGVAVRELAAMDTEGKVHGHFLTVEAAVATTELGHLAADATESRDVRQEAGRALRHLHAVEKPAELASAAREALARAKAARSKKPPSSPTTPEGRQVPVDVRPYGVRAFVMTISETDYWWLHYDPAEIGAALTPAQWEQFNDWVDQAQAFRDTAASTAKDSA